MKLGGTTIVKLYALFLGFVFLLVILKTHARINIDRTIVYVILLISLSWASLLWSINPNASLRINSSYTLLPLLFLLIYLSNFSEKEKKYLEIAIVCSGLLVVLYILATQGVLHEATTRVTVTGDSSSDPNGLVGRLLLPLIISIKLTLTDRKIRNKLVFMCAALMILMSALSTGSRGGLLSLISIAITVMVLAPTKNRIKAIALFCLLIVFLLFFANAYLPETVFERLFTRQSYLENRLDTNTRSYIWDQTCSNIIPNMPPWGLGSGCAAFRHSGMHNTFLTIIIEYGIFGIPIIIALIFHILKYCFQNKDYYGVCILVSILVNIMFLDSYGNNYFWDALAFCSIGLYQQTSGLKVVWNNALASCKE